MKRRYTSTHFKSKHNTGGWERTDNLEREGEKKEERKETEEGKRERGREEREMKGERRENKEGDMDVYKKRERE